MSRTSKLLLLSAALLLLLASANSARATIFDLEANLDGLQMVPPNASPAFGNATATLDDSTNTFAIVLGTYNDLLGGSTQILLNDAPVGSNGPFIGVLVNDTPGAATGTFSGSLVLTGAQAADMIAGNTYLRVTSNVFPGGEIRGQLTLVPEPGSIALAALGSLGVLVVASRRRRHSH